MFIDEGEVNRVASAPDPGLKMHVNQRQQANATSRAKHGVRVRPYHTQYSSLDNGTSQVAGRLYCGIDSRQVMWTHVE
jgi:hypothetical protein